MSRASIAIDDLESLASNIRESLARIDGAIALIRECEPALPSLLIHTETFRKQVVPRLFDWSLALEKEAKSQVNSHRLGVLSRAQQIRAEHDRRKQREAERSPPAPAKPARKKPAK